MRHTFLVVTVKWLKSVYIYGSYRKIKKVKKVKAEYSSSWESHLRATGRHLPYGITQCYLAPDTSERAPP